ncbi:hypothetical protein A2U01_0065853, partial [Trifolium medium]|nr:hypothetical protein [Trifolium medium]
MPVGRSLVL